MANPLAFDVERQNRSTSWKRARPTDALIEQTRWDRWLVTLPGGEAHEVELRRDHGALLGACDCRGYEFRDHPGSPCAHLCTLRKAAYLGEADTRGRRIQLVDPEEERAQNHSEKIAADGGRWR